MTPSCDIVLRPDGNRNADFILFCEIKPLEKIVKNYHLLDANTSQSNDNRKRLTGYFENKNQKYHFIPKAESIEPGLISFQEKLTMPASVVNKLLIDNEIERIATIAQPFLKDIISRYANYYSRQGSPDFSSAEIYDSLFLIKK